METINLSINLPVLGPLAANLQVQPVCEKMLNVHLTVEKLPKPLKGMISLMGKGDPTKAPIVIPVERAKVSEWSEKLALWAAAPVQVTIDGLAQEVEGE